MLYLSVFVLIPLAAVVVKAFSSGLGTLWSSIDNTLALRALAITLVASLIVAAIGAVMGTLVAWVLVRDSFPGKRFVNALIDLPFALPTIVAGLTLIALYGPDSPVGMHLAYTRGAVIVALMFVTLPFVVRSVQPVLIELDQRGRGGRGVVRRVERDHVPTYRPAGAPSGDLLRRCARVRPLDRRVRLAGTDSRQGADRLDRDLRRHRERLRAVGGGAFGCADAGRPAGAVRPATGRSPN